MSAAIGPGDWVECIDASPDWWGVDVPLTVGQIYRVRALQGPESGREAPPGRCENISLLLDGVHDGPDGDDGFKMERFRPIYRPRTDLIEQLKQPAPPAVRELIDA